MFLSRYVYVISLYNPLILDNCYYYSYQSYYSFSLHFVSTHEILFHSLGKESVPEFMLFFLRYHDSIRISTPSHNFSMSLVAQFPPLVIHRRDEMHTPPSFPVILFKLIVVFPESRMVDDHCTTLHTLRYYYFVP